MALLRSARALLPQASLAPLSLLAGTDSACQQQLSYGTANTPPAQSGSSSSGGKGKSLSQAAEVLPKSPVVPKVEDIPTTVGGGQAFAGDLRSTSGLGAGDGITSHTEKWMQNNRKSPMQYIQESEPILVEGPVVASYGSDDPALGCPVEFINLKGTSYENPAVCKYTGNKYYSLPHTWKAH